MLRCLDNIYIYIYIYIYLCVVCVCICIYAYGTAYLTVVVRQICACFLRNISGVGTTHGYLSFQVRHTEIYNNQT